MPRHLKYLCCLPLKLVPQDLLLYEVYRIVIFHIDQYRNLSLVIPQILVVERRKWIVIDRIHEVWRHHLLLHNIYEWKFNDSNNLMKIVKYWISFDISFNLYTKIVEKNSFTSHFHHPFQLSKLSSCRDRRKDIKLLNLNLLSLFLEDWIDRVVTTQSILYHYSEKIH